MQCPRPVASPSVNSCLQKYRFVGNQDVPDWILAEVSVLSKIVRTMRTTPFCGAGQHANPDVGALLDSIAPCLTHLRQHMSLSSAVQSCVRLKLICRQVINELAGGDLDFEKITKLIPKDSGFTWSDVKATVAAISFILSAATKYAVDHEVLNSELQQLGLPKENSDGISRPFRIHSDRLRGQAASESLRLPRLVSVAYRTDAVIATSVAGQLKGGAPEYVVHLSLGMSHPLNGRGSRVPSHEQNCTPLLLEAAGLQATAAKRTAAGPAARQGLLNAACVALGVTPLAPTDGSDLLSPKTSALRLVVGAGSVLSQTAPTSGVVVKVPARVTVDVTLSSTQLHALIAELRIARKVAQTVVAATTVSAAASSSNKHAREPSSGAFDDADL